MLKNLLPDERLVEELLLADILIDEVPRRVAKLNELNHVALLCSIQGLPGDSTRL